MSLAVGGRFGSYEILCLLGAGGMGEVYRARDTKLNRDVAIKVLPDRLASDGERFARFTREAQMLAALNHPNIAHVHGLEESGAVRALVMELVEGEDVSQRIARGPIPIDDALPIAKQIAEALEAAHEQGIVHRDLKPANIKVRPDGVVKVLDFGLAKLAQPETGGGHADVMASPTITTPAMMTGVGVILGTAAYMSPEQAKGREADKRSDIWAFGCVLFEMLTGTRAFPGEDLSDTLANVLKSEPDWAALPTATPDSVRRLMRRCLTKDRKRRLDSAAAVGLEIDDALTAPAAVAPMHAAAPRVPLWRKVMPVAAVVLVGLAAGYTGWTLRPAAPRLVTRFELPLAAGVEFGNPNFQLVALSADGTRLVYAIGNNSLYLRALDRLEPELIAGGPQSTLVRTPFFSPDGQWIGFWQDGQLKKVSVSGGAPIVLCSVEQPPFGATWAADNTILFALGAAGVWRVSGNSGTAERIITLDAGQRALGPQLLPDGRHVLFTLAQTANWNEAQLVVQSIDSGARHTLIEGTAGRYLPTGHIVYALRGTVFVVQFDPGSVRIADGPRPLVEAVWQAPGTGSAQFAVSSEGTLASVPSPARFSGARAQRTLAWVDRQGREEMIMAPPRPYLYPRLSPDRAGMRLALDIADDNRDIYMWHFPRGPLQRLTSHVSADRQPIWTPDGERIIFSSDRDGIARLFSQIVNGSEAPERLFRVDSGNTMYAHTMSPDGKHLVIREADSGRTPDLMVIDVVNQRLDQSRPAERARSRPLVQTSFAEFNAEISPDGQWLAFQSNSSGTNYEIYVQPFPNAAGNLRQVSTAGGTEPLWARDGRELFYRDPKGAVMRVSVTPGSSWTAAPPTQVIDASAYVVGVTEFPYRTYDVSPDGGRFLMIKDVGNAMSPTQRIVVVRHWFEELRQRFPVP